jgi:hypothetical protein
MTPDSVRALIRRACKEAGSQKAWCKQHGIGEAFLSQVLRGEREPSPAILDIFDLEKVVSYRRKQDG